MDISEKDFESAIVHLLTSGMRSPRPAGRGAGGEDLLALAESPGAYTTTGASAPSSRALAFQSRDGQVPPVQSREEQAQALGSYVPRLPTDYDRDLCLLPRDLLDFIYATQPNEWEKFKRQHGDDARARLLQRVEQEIRARGTLDVLRSGVKAHGCKFVFAYFRPVSGLNAASQTLYAGNIFAVVRQLHYSRHNENSLDLALFLNGLPLFTAELKNPLTGQNVQNAVAQYRNDRDPRESLFAFGRVLAHFAVDPDLVQMATHLQGRDTRFLPFNRGRNGGAGNPPASPTTGGFATEYLWRDVLAPDSVLDLVQRFIQIVEDEDDEGRKTGKRTLIFPRYHQLDAVRRLVADARQRGAGHRYLVQHSAGSGKSNSIAWLAHQLSTLHDDQDRRVFDTILVITDRRVLDKQLQSTVRQFEQTLGVVENIDTTSRQLTDALKDGKDIIVTTLQKFPHVAGQIEALADRRFAVIIDEAHSSQSGESTHSLKLVLKADTLEEAEEEDQAVTADDIEDRIAREMLSRQFAPNASYYAFTATPKPKTLELFGARRPDGTFAAFSVYSMRQAIEEVFILDVLQNYTTYRAYWSLLKKIEDDPRYDRKKAEYLLTRYVSEHPGTIARRVAVMLEHFAAHTAHRINGKAKAMIVTRSRLHAVRYKLAVDDYLREHDSPYKALVAFSGEVKDGVLSYTEAGMNGFPDSQTARTFKRDEYRILIVAEKFQTGFDQPLLHTMYVDKKLSGVNAVQTLSRLNRVAPGKEETMVLDFANETDEIEKAFKPYFETTRLTAGTDPNILYDVQTRLRAFHFYTDAEIQRFAELYFDPKATQDRLHAALAPAAERYTAATEEERVDFRGQLADFVRQYAFLSQVISFVDADLEKFYVFARLLLRKLPPRYDTLPAEVQRNIDIDSYRIQQTSSGSIRLPRGESDVNPIGPVPIYAPYLDELEALSQIIRELNQRFGTDFSDDDRLCIRDLETRLAANPALEASVRANTLDNARLTFDHVVNDLMQDLVDSHFKFYKQVNDDPAFSRAFLDWLFERYLRASQPPS